MPKPRGREHTSLTETAQVVVRVLARLPGVKMIAPGEISPAARGGARFITIVHTTAGLELIISGQSVQKVAVHLTTPSAANAIVQVLKTHKKLSHFTCKERERKPGI